MLNLESLKVFCQTLNLNQPVFVGYSGGVDSHVLLHALASLRETGFPIELHAVHVNHHLNKDANQWAAHCQQICDGLRVPLLHLSVQIKRALGESLEALARIARYQVIVERLEPGAILLTGHHQEDQAETVLLQLLRGAGLKGLSAMPTVKTLSHLQVARPLLQQTRSAILLYAKQHQLQWIEDDSNENIAFSRNYLRHRIMPLLKEKWPGCMQTLTRSAQHCRDANRLLEMLADQELKSILSDDGRTLSISKLLKLEGIRQKWLIRHWIEALGLPLPSAIKLDHVLRNVLQSKIDANPLVTWAGVEVRRFQDRLYIMPPLAPVDLTQTLAWDMRTDLRLPGDLGVLQKQSLQGIDSEKIQGPVEVRFRRGGETMRLPGRDGCHKLKTLFQEWGVPPWLRDRLPLIFYQGELIWVVGYTGSRT